MTTATFITAALRVPRPVYALAALALVAAGVVLSSGEGVWVPWAAALVAPDLALLLAPGKGLEKGQIHARAVPYYNAAHMLWGPAALLAVALGADLGAGWVAAGLAWAAHVALDRSIGYGLRTPEGLQRGV
jgi:hypothetical protein